MSSFLGLQLKVLELFFKMPYMCICSMTIWVFIYVERSGNDSFIVNYLTVLDSISFIHISKVYKLYTFINV